MNYTKHMSDAMRKHDRECEIDRAVRAAYESEAFPFPQYAISIMKADLEFQDPLTASIRAIWREQHAIR